jgi:hypothetical protein
MSRGIFEEVGSLPIRGIYGINFAYDTTRGLHTTSSLNILKLSAIVLAIAKKVHLERK